MRKQVQEASIDCYHAIRKESKLSRQQVKVLGMMRAGFDYSLQEISAATSMPINAVSGRVNELRIIKRLMLGATRKCSVTGRTIRAVRLPLLQELLF